jgi:hypothetical protein
MEFVQKTSSIRVPKSTGIKGLLDCISALISEVPRVSRILIESNGEVTYTWPCPVDGESKPFDLSFEDSMPYAVIRNTRMVDVGGKDPADSLAALFAACHKDRLYPICIVTGTDTKLWSWLSRAVFGQRLDPSDTLYGYMILADREVPDDSLLLCAGYARSQSIADTHVCYKISMED